MADKRWAPIDAAHQASIDEYDAECEWVEQRTMELMDDMDIDEIAELIDCDRVYGAVRELLVLRHKKVSMPEPLAGIVERLYCEVEGLFMDQAEDELKELKK